MTTVAIEIGYQRAERVILDLKARAQEPGSEVATWPGKIREGAGSLHEQIERRTYEDLTGGSHPWAEAFYAEGRPIPERVAAGEQILWSAALGGAGSITRVTARAATIGVDDGVVRELAAGIGNGIVSQASYIGFVTGDFAERQTPAVAYGVKPAIGRSRHPPKRAGLPHADHPQTHFAMWWFLGLSYDFWTTADRFAQGFVTPPKNMGPSRRMVDRIRDGFAAFLLGRQVYRGAA